MSAVGATQPALGASDEALVAAVRRGDDRAFGELYSRYGGRIVAYVLGMVGDHGRAEDIGQEVFISALRRMRATERPIAFKPWVYEIAKNACIDEFRRTRRTKEVPLDSDDDREGPLALVSRGPTPDKALESRQQLDDLQGAFRGLSDNHHKILVLRELEGLSYTEIGRRMGMTRPVVESTLFRARRRLGQEYEEIASGQRCEQVHAVIDAGGATAVRALGIREHRRIARHVAHCQPCRRYAWAAGVDDVALKPASIREKIAALLPIPAFLRWRRHGSDVDAAKTSGSHSMATASQTATQLAGPGSPAAGLGRVAAAVAALAVASGGVVAGVSSQSSKPAQHKFTPAAASASGLPGTAREHRIAPPAKHAAKAVVASKTPGASGSSTSASSAGGSSTASNQPAAQQSRTPSASTASASTSGSTNSGTTGSGLLSVPSLPKTQLPSLPKVDAGSVSSDVSNLTQTVTSTVNSTVNTVSDTLNGG